MNRAAAAGTISTSGLYTAPAAAATQQTVSIVATSQADNTKTGKASMLEDGLPDTSYEILLPDASADALLLMFA